MDKVLISMPKEKKKKENGLMVKESSGWMRIPREIDPNKL